MKPANRLTSRFFQCAGFFEQLGGLRNDNKSFIDPKLFIGMAVDIRDRIIESADDQKRRCFDL